jgi:hypothetical protein
MNPSITLTWHTMHVQDTHSPRLVTTSFHAQVSLKPGYTTSSMTPATTFFPNLHQWQIFLWQHQMSNDWNIPISYQHFPCCNWQTLEFNYNQKQVLPTLMMIPLI